MEISQVSKSDFFGKDKMTQFIGVIEDVNDPKQAGRVKVRCVGWHPMDKEGEDGVATEDLPWARVSAPTTHAQQGRVGSKHGLLPGCWVWGFFLDGDDGQDPMVIGSFPFTAKTVTKDLHTRPQEGEKPGTQESTVKGFTQYDGNVRWPNTALQTAQEKGSEAKAASDPTDPGAAAPGLDESQDNDCGDRRSAFNLAKEDDYKETSNPPGQKLQTMMGDGGCGTVAHAKDDVQRVMAEKMPSEFDRILFNDAVWNKFSGSFMNMNGIMAQLSLDICARIRMLLTQSKAFQEENVNRPTETAAAKVAADREGIGVISVDKSMGAMHDVFHMIFTQLMEQMCGQVMAMLQEMDSSSGSGGGGDSDSDDDDGSGKNKNNDDKGSGSERTRDKNKKSKNKKPGLQDPGADCVAEQIMQNIQVMNEDMLNESFRTAMDYIKFLGSEYEIVTTNPKDWSNYEPPGYDLCAGFGDYSEDDWSEYFDQVQKDVEDAIKEADDGNGSGSGGSGGGGLGDFGSIFSQLGSITNLLQFSSMQKFAIPGAKSHSNIGNATLDERIRQGGCRQERMYDSVQGAVNGMVGGATGAIGSAASQLGGLQSLTNQFSPANSPGTSGSGNTNNSSGGNNTRSITPFVDGLGELTLSSPSIATIKGVPSMRRNGSEIFVVTQTGDAKIDTIDWYVWDLEDEKLLDEDQKFFIDRPNNPETKIMILPLGLYLIYGYAYVKRDDNQYRIPGYEVAVVDRDDVPQKESGWDDDYEANKPTPKPSPSPSEDESDNIEFPSTSITDLLNKWGFQDPYAGPYAPNNKPESGKGSKGDGQQDGLKNNTLINKTKNLGYGGRDKSNAIYTTQLCEDSKTKKEKVKKEKRKQDKNKDKWKSTSFCIDKPIKRLKGEKTIDGKTTQNSRVLLFKQKNKTENGIWITSKGEWERAEDANHPKEFISGREIVTCKKTIEYIGKKNPVIDEDDLIFKEVVKDPDEELIEFKPPGKKGRVVNISVPSGDKESAENFNNGTPNQIVVVEAGEEYHFEDGTNNNFPSIFIPGYNGTPVPVVDKKSGEIVSILTNPKSYDPNLPQAGVGIIADTNPIGITTDDPDYDVVLGGIFVGNTGFDYGAGKDNRNNSKMEAGNPIISIIDRDTGKENGKAKATIVSGRIVDIEIINSGSGFLRIPEVRIRDKFGFGAQLYPVMSVVPRPQAKPLPVPVKMVFCPGKGQVNGVPRETPRQVTGIEVMQNFDPTYVPTVETTSTVSSVPASIPSPTPAVTPAPAATAPSRQPTPAPQPAPSPTPAPAPSPTPYNYGY